MPGLYGPGITDMYHMPHLRSLAITVVCQHAWFTQCWDYICVPQCLFYPMLGLKMHTSMPLLYSDWITDVYHQGWCVQCCDYQCTSLCPIYTVLALSLRISMPGLYSPGITDAHNHAWFIHSWDYRCTSPQPILCWDYKCVLPSLVYVLWGLHLCTYTPNLYNAGITYMYYHS